MLHSFYFIQCSFGNPNHSREEKEIKIIQIGKEDIKCSLFADDMMLYTENPKDAIRKLLELINKFSNISAYKVNIQNLLHFYKLTIKYHKE